MIVIYSDKEVKGVAGVYCSPLLFDGKVDRRATLVITNSPKISSIYKEAGVEVKGFPRSKPPTESTVQASQAAE
jgi:hypothetical protein